VEVYIKHQPGGRQGAWSQNEYTIHIAWAGRTLCKNGRPDGPADGRLSERGWRRMKLPAQMVSCLACLQRVDRNAVESLPVVHDEQPMRQVTRLP
jgi:hypothetical protein